MHNSALENTQHIYDLISLCVEFGVRNVILCPGSRCAPLLLGFGHHPNINVVSVPDERSGGFIGLGIAQQTNTPVVLICTSGTAAQNFYPSVTEAFYQKNRLIILTADRPKEWIDQWDGQTIQQQNIFQPFVKAFIQMPTSFDFKDASWTYKLKIAQGFHLANQSSN